jgi:hypothetical protein
MKELTEKDLEFLNSKILKHIEKLFQGKAGINGDEATYMNDLTSIAKKLLGDKYKSTTTSDAIPFLTDTKPYCIVNLDNSHQGGSHWIAISKYPKKDRYLVYDSFGRKTHKILPSALNKFGRGSVVDTDHDKEQNISETNCGQRSLAFLILTDLFGIQNSEKL